MTRTMLIAAASASGLGLISMAVAMTAPGTPTSTSRTLEITVVIQNLAPANGTFLTPVWVGFHDGSFDTYDRGAPISGPLERLAEDGNTTPISDAFLASGAGLVDGTVISDFGNPPIAPGQTATMTFTLEGDLDTSRYFSYASMVIPSNDAFVANGDPLAHPIFTASGSFVGADFVVLGVEVVDAGSELNDENPENTAFLNQTVADTGLDESVGIHDHVGFKFPGSGGILDVPMFGSGDFRLRGYEIARITVTAEPGDDDSESSESSDSSSDDD